MDDFSQFSLRYHDFSGPVFKIVTFHDFARLFKLVDNSYSIKQMNFDYRDRMISSLERETLNADSRLKLLQFQFIRVKINQ